MGLFGKKKYYMKDYLSSKEILTLLLSLALASQIDNDKSVNEIANKVSLGQTITKDELKKIVAILQALCLSGLATLDKAEDSSSRFDISMEIGNIGSKLNKLI